MPSYDKREIWIQFPTCTFDANWFFSYVKNVIEMIGFTIVWVDALLCQSIFNITGYIKHFSFQGPLLEWKVSSFLPSKVVIWRCVPRWIKNVGFIFHIEKNIHKRPCRIFCHHCFFIHFDKFQERRTRCHLYVFQLVSWKAGKVLHKFFPVWAVHKNVQVVVPRNEAMVAMWSK